MNYKNFSGIKLSSIHKTRAIAIAFVALLMLSAVIEILPLALAKTYTAVFDRDTGTFVAASPELIGLGQKVFINIITYPAPSGPTLYAQDLVSKFGGLGNTSVTITKPDGTKDTFMPIDASLEQIGIKIPGLQQIVGSLMFYYAPNQVGNYSITASFPGQTYTTDEQYANLNLTVYYKPSSSAQATTFTVQEEQVLSGQLNGYPWSSLPTAYWQDPVSTNNREWAAISGDWVIPDYDALRTRYNPFSKAPSSPHIIWANQVSSEGLIGGIWGSQPYSSGVGGIGSIVLDGKIYQNSKSGYFDCIDLRTGELLWSAPGSVTLAQRLDPFYQTAAQQNEGQIDECLWGMSGSNWVRYNPFNGDVLQNITKAPTDTSLIAFQDGNPVVWVTQTSRWNTTLPLKYAWEGLIKWNLTKVTGNDWLTGIQWNVSIRQPDGVGLGDGRQSLRVYPFDGANVAMCKAGNDENLMFGFDMTTGAYLWRTSTVIDLGGSGNPSGGSNGPLIMFDGATGSYLGYDAKTGQETWATQVGKLPWAALPAYSAATNNGNVYVGCYDGHVYALNIESGKIVWKSDYYGDEDESIYGTQPFNYGAAGADGKLFFSTQTTYRLMPRTRFHALVSIDEATGHFLWKLPIGIQPSAIANGYLLGTDPDNGIQYCIGKGQTATAVTPLNSATSGIGMTIQGSILDMSPGKPNTAAVSDADMSIWMDYLYGQNATLINSPPTPQGVTVQLKAVDPNGNAIDLGTVTSDFSGHFAKSWTPTTAGLYTIYATFAGSNSYYSSYGETSVTVNAAAVSPSATTITQGSVTSSDIIVYLIIGVIAIIIAIALVGALILRKK